MLRDETAVDAPVDPVAPVTCEKKEGADVVRLPLSEADCQLLVEKISNAYKSSDYVWHCPESLGLLELVLDDWIPSVQTQGEKSSAQFAGNPFVYFDNVERRLVYNKTLDDNLLRRTGILNLLVEAVRHFEIVGFSTLQINFVLQVLFRLNQNLLQETSADEFEAAVATFLRHKIVPMLSSSPLRVFLPTSRSQSVITPVPVTASRGKGNLDALSAASKSPKESVQVSGARNEATIAVTTAAREMLVERAFSYHEIGLLVDYISVTMLQHAKLFSQVYRLPRPVVIKEVAVSLNFPENYVVHYPLQRALPEAAFKEMQESKALEAYALEQLQKKEAEKRAHLKENSLLLASFLQKQATEVAHLQASMKNSSVLRSVQLPSALLDDFPAQSGGVGEAPGATSLANSSALTAKPAASEKTRSTVPANKKTPQVAKHADHSAKATGTLASDDSGTVQAPCIIDEALGLPKVIVDGIAQCFSSGALSAPTRKPGLAEEAQESENAQMLQGELEKCFAQLRVQLDYVAKSRFQQIAKHVQEIGGEVARIEAAKVEILNASTLNQDPGEKDKSSLPVKPRQPQKSKR